MARNPKTAATYQSFRGGRNRLGVAAIILRGATLAKRRDELRRHQSRL